MEKSEYRCETCGDFIAGMENLFGAVQPFCKNPKVVEYLKAKPESVIDTPIHVSLKERYMNEKDLWFYPMTKGGVELISILGCCGHSKYPIS